LSWSALKTVLGSAQLVFVHVQEKKQRALPRSRCIARNSFGRLSRSIAHETQQRLQTQLIYALLSSRLTKGAQEDEKLPPISATNYAHLLTSSRRLYRGYMRVLAGVTGGEFPAKLQQDIYQIHQQPPPARLDH